MRFVGSKYAKNAFAAVAAPPQEPHPFGRRSKTAPFKQKYWLRHCKDAEVEHWYRLLQR